MSAGSDVGFHMSTKSGPTVRAISPHPPNDPMPIVVTDNAPVMSTNIWIMSV